MQSYSKSPFALPLVTIGILCVIIGALWFIPVGSTTGEQKPTLEHRIWYPVGTELVHHMMNTSNQIIEKLISFIVISISAIIGSVVVTKKWEAIAPNYDWNRIKRNLLTANELVIGFFFMFPGIIPAIFGILNDYFSFLARVHSIFIFTLLAIVIAYAATFAYILVLNHSTDGKYRGFWPAFFYLATTVLIGTSIIVGLMGLINYIKHPILKDIISYLEVSVGMLVGGVVSLKLTETVGFPVDSVSKEPKPETQ